MDAAIRDKFADLWDEHFDGTQLPIIFYYSNRQEDAELPQPHEGHRCVIADISDVRKGKTLCLDVDSVSCGGGQRYLGFMEEIMPNFENFLSSGCSGEAENEGNKKTPPHARGRINRALSFKSPGKFIVFKRWDRILTSDEPEVVVFFARPDVMSSLFALSTFNEADLNGVFSPFGPDCATIVHYPYLEKDSDHPRAVLGMSDISPRPCVPWDVRTFSMPMIKFTRMVNSMEKSFFVTA